ncbi:helix-turn-helix domain-containing protein [uncultured Selenomonas sp.]|uniref:helix-turn-helix domain-containing protein n=1 Tax=uncultured Selenomonas sp. TaxID=159275 RepID=UPI0025F140E5|nr:helix-turn-helix transcriptional regulator [uncultured Selenomonas sp.]
MTFGENLKALRKARGLTQEEFAKQSGISRSAIGMYESGKREPKNFEMLETIADFFNVDMNTLLGTSKAPAPPAAQPPTTPYRTPQQEMPEYIELHRIIQELPKADVDEILNMARFKKDRIKNKKEHIDDPDDF